LVVVVVVVVMGEGSVVEVWVVVVEVCVVSSVPHPVRENKAAAATQERRMVFIKMIMGGWLI
jgi:hypothetical protein